MSGIKRLILAEIMKDGKSSQAEIVKAMSPQAIREEKGRSIYTPVSRNPDKGEYLGKNVKSVLSK